jgi:CMP-N-acetylneuraminic acid synthetase
MNLNIIALIPARSGSKGIPDKNIKLYKGLPLLVHSINIAKESKYINDVYVSTDSNEYQDIALKYNAKVTPLRSAEISDDLSPDIETFKFFLNSLDYNNSYINCKPDIIIHLRPTYPNRKVELLDDCIEQFIQNYNSYDSLRTVILIKKCPVKMYYIENNKLIPYFKEYNNLIEPYNQARQCFPDTYLHNGCIDIVKTSIILNNNLLSGYSILPYIMDEIENDDIDDIDDFNNSINKKI